MDSVGEIGKWNNIYPEDIRRMGEQAERVILLQDNGKTDLENIGHLGEGWKGE